MTCATPGAWPQGGLLGSLFQDAEIGAAFAGDSMLANMLDFETAWVQALQQGGIVDDTMASEALAGIAGCQIDRERLARATDRDGLPVPDLVTQLRANVPERSRIAVHTGATSQDVLDTAMVLSLRNASRIIADRLDVCVRKLDALHHRDGTNSIMARTRMQAAFVIPVASRIDAWRRPLAAHRAQLDAVRSALERVQYGGAVGTRQGLPLTSADMSSPRAGRAHGSSDGEAVMRALAALLDLAPADVWHTDRSSVVSYGNWLVLLTGSLAKIAQDIILMAQQGIDEVDLSAGGSSSAMPHKKNPVTAEAVVSLARFVAVQQGLLGQAMVHEQERSGVAWALEWLTLPAMVEAAGTALRHVREILENTERLGSVEGS